MPLIPFDLPEQTIEVVAANTWGEHAQLFAAAHGEGDPNPVTLTELSLNNGSISAKPAQALGTQAMWWDAGYGGLWAVNGKGLAQLPSARRIAAMSTPMANLGPASPTRSQIAHDLDGDGTAELIFWSSGQYSVWRGDGSPLGSIYAPAHAELRSDRRDGGQVQLATHTVPTLVVADVDGDGLKDLILPHKKTLKIHYSSERSVDARRATWALPIGLSSDEITDLHWVDATGDGKVDLLLHRVGESGSFFGKEGQFCLYENTGSSMVKQGCQGTGSSSYEVYPKDLDQDGDMDLVVPLVDTSFSGLARGLVARSIPIQLAAFEYAGGAYASSPKALLAVQVSLEEPEIAWSMDGDFDGDGTLDLALAQNGILEIYTGTEIGLSASPWREHPISHKVERILVSNLAGDTRPEILLWTPREQNASIWQGE